MRQRVSLARALAVQPDLILLDEPFASLDAITRADLQRLLVATLRDERRTTLLVTHDVEEALYVADRVAVLSPRPGRLVWTIDSPSSGDRDLPRAAAISRPGFVAAREQALEILVQGSGR
jgi:NitT/TauT family transport system ATP-binding protein